MSGLLVDECPKALSPSPTKANHAIYSSTYDAYFALQLFYHISYLPIRKPSRQEVASDLPLVHLTSQSYRWNPHDETMSNLEHRMTTFDGTIHHSPRVDRTIATISINHYGNQHVQHAATTIPVSDADAVLPAIFSALHLPTFAHNVSSLTSTNRKYRITPAALSELWNISLPIARNTLARTTQYSVRTSRDPSMSRRYSTNDRAKRYTRLFCNVFMDTFFANKAHSASERHFKSAQIFATEFNFVHIIPMRTKADVPHALKQFFKTLGVPDAIICDSAREQILGHSKKLCDQVDCAIRPLEPYTPWSNRAELHVGKFKSKILSSLKRTDAPMKFWCYCAEYHSHLHNRIAHDYFLLQGHTPFFKLTGRMPDISELVDLSFYDWCIYRDPIAKFPENPMKIGRYLSPAHHCGNAMTNNILTSTGRVLPITTVRPLNEEELNSPTETAKRKVFNDFIRSKFGDSINPPPPISTDASYTDKVDPTTLEDSPPIATPPPTTITTQTKDPDDFDDYDHYLSSEVLLTHNGKPTAAHVVRRSTNPEGRTMGKFHHNPLLNTRVYDVCFPDGVVEQYAANTIAMNILSQVDDNGHRHQLLSEIIDYRKDGKAVPIDQGFTKSKNGNHVRKKTTKGWYFLVRWTDDTSSWIRLIDLKHSNPLELADFVLSNQLQDEPAFAWWLPHCIKKRDQIIASIQARSKQTTHKYGIRVPRTVKEAYELDETNNNTYWRDAIRKEMQNVSVAFDFLPANHQLDADYKYLPCHLIFDVKMDFTRKARFVADGHRVADPVHSTYAGVVSRESVRIAFTYAALLGLDVLAGDIQNAYLQAPSSEKLYTIAGPEFGSQQGMKLKIIRALYGGKSSGRDFRNHLRHCMTTLGFEPCEADHDVWMRPATTPAGLEYYEYVLLYVDDTLVISHNAQLTIDRLNKFFKMKPSSIGPPNIYLGGKVSKVELPNGVRTWAYSSSQYVQAAVKNVNSYLKEHNQHPLRGAKSPISMNYRPELDTSPELDPPQAAHFQSLIGILRWIVELGRMDISVEVSMLSSMLASPRDGHLQQVYHIFSYLKTHHNARIVFDPSIPDINLSSLTLPDWSSFYGNAKEVIPENMPCPKGREMALICYVDADHATDKVTRRSRTGFIIFLNSSPIYWYSKRQNSVETSSFGSEFVAMRQACEYIRSLRFHLRMMGIPVSQPAFLRGDNQSVIFNSTIPESMLKKKHNAVSYHFVREGCAKSEWAIEKVDTKYNPADILASPRSDGEDRRRKVRMMLYDIYDTDSNTKLKSIGKEESDKQPNEKKRKVTFQLPADK